MLMFILDNPHHPAKIKRRTSCRSQATKVQRPRISSVGSRRSGTVIVIMPAAGAHRELFLSGLRKDLTATRCVAAILATNATGF
jgi:hypothetical protein